MKKIDTFIQPLYWDQTRAALQRLGVSGTLRQVKTFGRTPGRREVYRGSSYVLDTTSELELSVTVRDELLEATLAALQPATCDAEIFVSSVETVPRGEAKRAIQAESPRAVASERTPEYAGFVTAARA
jgi:nitrogen regulatory protein PII